MSLTRRVAVPLAALVLGASRAALAVCHVTSACSAAPFLAPASGCCGATTCTIDGTVSLSGPVCNLDFGARNVTLSGSLVVGSGTLALAAGGLTVTGLLNARGAGKPGGNVTLTLGVGGLSLEGGTGIDLEGYGVGGGSLTATVDGSVSLTAGSINASALETNASGGTITLRQTAGSTPMTVGISILADAQTNGVGGTITLQAPADLNLTDTSTISAVGGYPGSGSIELDAGGTVTVAGAAAIRAPGFDGSAGDGGDIAITAGSVEIDGTLDVSGGSGPTLSTAGDGGTMEIEAKTGSLMLARNAAGPGLVADGAGAADAGEVDLATDSLANGVLTVAAPVSVQGHGRYFGQLGGGGTIDIESANALTVANSLNVSGVGGGGGTVSLSAVRDVVINSLIDASDSVGPGEVDVDAGHDVILAGIGLSSRLKVNATLDGVGGSISVVAGNDLTVTGFSLSTSGSGSGAGYLISLDAGHNLSIDQASALNANSGPGSGAPGGNITLEAGSPGLAGNLRLAGSVSANGHASTSAAANPASIVLNGCQVTISGTGVVDSSGDLNAANVVIGRKGISVAGKLRTTAAAMGGSNTATYPAGTTPAGSGSVSPPFGPCAGGCAKPVCTAPDTPAGCLVPCPACGDGKRNFPEQCDPPGCPTCDLHCRLFMPAGCMDTNACTTDTCDSTFGCQFEPKPDGFACDDTTVCNGHEVCESGACGIGTPLDCDDGDPCTADSCDAVAGCQHAPITGPPAPGATSCTDRCAEACSNGACAPITPPTCTGGTFCDPTSGMCVTKPCTSDAQCDYGNPCVTHSCPSGHCYYVPVANGTSCADGNACNGLETCVNGVCERGTPVNCDDGNLCTNDVCDQATGNCSHPRIPGCCQTSTDCDDGSPCTTDVCTNHECSNTIVPNCCQTDPDCDDGNPCTTDSCSNPTHQTTGTCQHAAVSGIACGDVCQPATCQSGTCVNGTPLSCPDDGDVCTQDFCDPSSGCIHPRIAGCCHNDAECNDANPCTTDACDPSLHLCTNDPISLDCRPCLVDTDCDPAGACGFSVCNSQAGYCIDHTPPRCDDGNCDTTDSCVVDGPGAAHCEHRPGACNDGNACNGVESCAGGFCMHGPAPSCDDGNFCTDDSCDTTAGCQHTPKTSFAAVSCRLDTIDAAIQGASVTDLAPSVAAKLGKPIGKARTKLAAAETAGHGKPALKALRKAAKQLKLIPGIVRSAQKRHKISASVAAALLDAASGGSQALSTLMASITP